MTASPDIGRAGRPILHRRPEGPEPLPRYVSLVRSRGREYYYYQRKRGSQDAGPRIRLPGHPQSSEFWSALEQAQSQAEKMDARPCIRRQPIGKVYFARSGAYMKIGHSRDVNKRIKAINTSAPERVELMMVIPGTAEDEKRLHKRFQHLRSNGEWFHFTGELCEFVERRRAAQ